MVIRCMSRMSATIWLWAMAFRRMVSRARAVAAASSPSWSRWAQPTIAFSGVRSSCESVARNSSLRRLAWSSSSMRRSSSPCVRRISTSLRCSASSIWLNAVTRVPTSSPLARATRIVWSFWSFWSAIRPATRARSSTGPVIDRPRRMTISIAIPSAPSETAATITTYARERSSRSTRSACRTRVPSARSSNTIGRLTTIPRASIRSPPSPGTGGQASPAGDRA